MTFKNLLPATLLVAVCIAWLAIASLRPQTGQTQLGVVFPPDLNQKQVLSRIADSGGRLVREGAWPFITVIALDGPDTTDRLRDAGALFTVNPLILGSCLTRPAASRTWAQAN